MRHDIAHCKGIGCPIKDNCFRYKAHLEVEQGKFTIPVLYFIEGWLCQRAIYHQNNKTNE